MTQWFINGQLSRFAQHSASTGRQFIVAAARVYTVSQTDGLDVVPECD